MNLNNQKFESKYLLQFNYMLQKVLVNHQQYTECLKVNHRLIFKHFEVMNALSLQNHHFDKSLGKNSDQQNSNSLSF